MQWKEEGSIPEFGCIIGGEERRTGDTITVRFPYTGEPVATVHQAAVGDLDDAVACAVRGFQATRDLSSWERSRILTHLARSVEGRSVELADLMVREGGKTRTFARNEVTRAAETLRISAEEARRIGGEVIPLDWIPGNDGRVAITRRFPLGPVLGIVPFNFPLNLACHKLGPAVASGNSLVLKPASATPLSAIVLGRMLLDAGFPREAISVVPCPGERAERLAKDARFAYLSFTGSPAVGWHLREIAGRKRVGLELGGNAAVIVHHDANLPYAADRIVTGGFTNAGQVCISVQRVFLHSGIYEDACRLILDRVAALRTGDPREEKTDVGPMINSEVADLAMAKVREAVGGGAKILAGGRAEGALFYPTVISGSIPQMRINCQEAFAPVITLTPYEEFDQALAMANASEYGLQMGIFTQNIQRILRAFARAEVGGIQINDISTFRADHMPYGGVKGSGMGKEGPRYAIEEMTEIRLLAMNPAGGLE
jgi:acyl-CoA reductase-like NAD-dependent aldehyde dehydrogenase